jgi:hypothetical protein
MANPLARATYRTGPSAAVGRSPSASLPRPWSGRLSKLSLLTWAADRESAGARRWLQLALGVIWLLDAALQYQPYMFTRAFPTQVIEPAGAGSPGFVAHPVMFAGQLMLHHEIIFNALFATIQLAIAVGLLWRPTVRAALAGSIVWALLIWWMGEGLGGIFTSGATPVTGAPGGAVLYALIAVLVWPSRSQENGTSVSSGSPAGRWGAKIAWLALWASSAYFLLLAPNRAAGALRDTISGGADGEPRWIASIERTAATAIGTHGTGLSIILAVVFAVVAAGIFIPAATRPVLVLAAVAAAAIWVLGQSFGEILTGQATDPNTGPLLILLAAAYWPLTQSSRRPADSGTTQS